MRVATYNIKNGLDLDRERTDNRALVDVRVVHLPVSDHRAVVAEVRVIKS